MRYTQTETKKAGGVHSKKECLFLPFPAYRAGKVLRLHLPNGEAAASGLVDTGNGHKGLGIDLRDQIASVAAAVVSFPPLPLQPDRTPAAMAMASRTATFFFMSSDRKSVV